MPKKITLSGAVGEEITLNSLKEELPKDGSPVEITLSSPGGYISDGFEIRNELIDYPGEIKIILSGVVASIASYITTAVKKENITARDNSVFMVHNAIGFTVGDHRAMESEGLLLKKFDSVLATAYSKQTGKPVEEMAALMSADVNNDGTWLFGQEIINNGFAGSLFESGEELEKTGAVAMAINSYSGMKLSPKKAREDIKRVAKILEPETVSPVINLETGDETVTKDELLKQLKTLKADNQVSMNEIAGILGASEMLVTEEHKAAVSKLAEINKALGDPEDVLSAIEGMKNDQKEVRKAKLDSLFGSEKNEAGKENPLRLYAENMIQDITPEALEKFKKDPIAMKLSAEKADYSSEQNTIGTVEGGEQTVFAGPFTVEV